jgi:hypothetical protein
MLVKITTPDGASVWVNPAYVISISTFVEVDEKMQKTLRRNVKIHQGGSPFDFILTDEPMDKLAARLNAKRAGSESV